MTSTITTTHLCFGAMSTEVNVTVVGGHHDLVEWARRRVGELEQCWSRFRADSELSRLNSAGGAAVAVSADMIAALRAACAAWVFTERAFDPTVHDSLLRLGYDDHIDEVRRRGDVGARGGPALPSPGCAGIVFDEATGVAQLPAGVRLDLGGIGKGLAADLVATGLVANGAEGAMVNIGGDLRVTGLPPAGDAWTIDIEDPRTDQPCAAVSLLDGGVATSTTLRRRWRQAMRPVHHLVSPGTGAPTTSPVVGASVVAGTAAWADALSKVPFVDPDRVDRFGAASALVMFDNGTNRAVGPLRFVARTAA